MDIEKMLTELRTEHERIEDAIRSLERLARGEGRRRGRPPKWWKEATGETQEKPEKKVQG